MNIQIQETVETIASEWVQNADLSMGEACAIVYDELMEALGGRNATPDLLRDIALNDFGVDLPHNV